MQNMSILDIEKEYNLELDKIVRTIKGNRAKSVLLHFPDGMKPFSTVIAAEIEKQTNSNVLIWLGTCYGGCDVPNADVDLIIQFGHSKWNYRDVKIV